MNLHKSGQESTLEFPSVTFPYLLIKSGVFTRKRTFHFAATAPFIITFVEVECTVDIQP